MPIAIRNISSDSIQTVPVILVMVARTGRTIYLSTARLAVMPAAVLAKGDAKPQVAEQLADLCPEGHWLIEVGYEFAERRAGQVWPQVWTRDYE
jgi:hypothetical protein